MANCERRAWESAEATMVASSAGVGALSLGAPGFLGAYTWKVTSLSTQTEAKLCSPSFTVGGIEWRMELQVPKRFASSAGASLLTLALQMVDAEQKPFGWNCHASVKLAVKSQTAASFTVTREYSQGFHRHAWHCGTKVRNNQPLDAHWMQSCLGALLLPLYCGSILSLHARSSLELRRGRYWVCSSSP